MIRDEKFLLRNKIKAYRRDMNEFLRERLNRAIFNNIVTSGILSKHKTVLCYLSTEFEVDTEQILLYCLENDIKAAVPRCVGQRGMDFYYYNSDSVLEMSKYGIIEPVPEKNELVTEFEDALCIVPALAYDRKGYRIGYGGGFYDTFIARHEAMKTLGICYSDNVFESIPKEDHDRPVDILITDRSTEALSNG